MKINSLIKRTVITSTTTITDTTTIEKDHIPVLDNKQHLDTLIEENARSLANIQEQFSKSKSKESQLPQSNVEGICPVPVSPSSSNISVKDTVSSASVDPLSTNTVEKDYSNNTESSAINSPINDIKPVSVEAIADEKLDAIGESVNKIRLAAQVTAEQAADLLRRNGVTIERTEQASRRLDALINRAESFIQSFNNPGRTVMYTAFGITALYSVYYVVRYGQLPLTGIVRGMMTGASAGTAGNQSSNSTTHVINFNYPERASNVSNSVPMSTVSNSMPMGTGNSEFTSLIHTLFSTPYFSMGIVGLVWVLRKVKK